MSTIRNPVGPQPAKVYWRRRLIVLLGLLAVILVIVLIVVRPGSGAANDGAAPSATDEPAASETTAPPSSTEVVPCTEEMIEVVAVTDAEAYDPTTQPQLSLEVTNTGEQPCTMQGGSDVQEYRITSGSEVIWTSKDCQTDPAPAEVQLQPGESVSGGPIPWDRTRSSKDTCETPREAVVAGGASYHLSVFIGDFQSEQTRQFVLN